MGRRPRRDKGKKKEINFGTKGFYPRVEDKIKRDHKDILSVRCTDAAPGYKIVQATFRKVKRALREPYTQREDCSNIDTGRTPFLY